MSDIFGGAAIPVVDVSAEVAAGTRNVLGGAAHPFVTSGGGSGGAPSGPAGGVLSGTYPNPSFAADMATQAELDSEASTRASADSALSTALSNEATTRADADTTFTTALAGKQPLNANLTALAGLPSAADTVPYFTGASAAALATFTGAARTFVAAVSAAAQRAALGLGLAATADLSATGGTGHVLRQSSVGGALTTAQLTALIIFRANGGIQTWTDQPAALTEWFTAMRTRVDLSGYTQARLTCRINTAGVAGSSVRIQYATDAGETTWAYLDGASGPQLSLTNAGTLAGSWVTLVSGAKADVVLRFVGIDGNGANDPAFGSIGMEVR